jgi:hypothetical protein
MVISKERNHFILLIEAGDGKSNSHHECHSREMVIRLSLSLLTRTSSPVDTEFLSSRAEV